MRPELARFLLLFATTAGGDLPVSAAGDTMAELEALLPELTKPTRQFDSDPTLLTAVGAVLSGEIVGAAARDVLARCRAALAQSTTLEGA